MKKYITLKIIGQKFDNFQSVDALMKLFPSAKLDFNSNSAELFICIEQKYDCDPEVLIEEMNKQAKENHIHATFEFVDFEKVCFGNSNRLNLSLELWRYFSKTFQNHFSHCSGRVP